MNGSRQAAAAIPSLWLLGIASGLSPFGMAIIVPSMGSLAREFSTNFADVQFVVSAYLFGLAIAQPLSGYLCDRYGRRIVMLTGFTLFTLTSLACAFADTLSLLILARFLQAAGVSVGTVASRAILRDTRSGEEMAEAMSYIAAAMGVAPVIAPVLGGVLDTTIGYRAVFIVSALFGAAVLLRMRQHLEETLPARSPRPRLADWFRNYGTLLRSPQFVGYTLIFGFVQGSFFAFLAIGAPYFESAYGVDARTFGFVWGFLAVVYVAGATLGARMTAKIGTDRTMAIGIWLNLLAGVALLLVGSSDGVAAAALLVPFAVLMALAGITTPGAMAGAVRFHPEIAGTASGLSSALGLVIGGGFTIVSGSLYDGTVAPVVRLIVGATIAALTSWALARLRQPRPHTG